MRLLPPDRPEMGWTPYVWLIYLVGFVAYPFMTHEPPLQVLGMFLGLAVFLGLYFWSFWLAGPRLLLAVSGIVVLALVYSPWNPGAASIWIYAAAVLGKLPKPRLAVRWLAALLGILAIESWLVPLSPYVSLSAGIFSLVIGGVCIQQEQFRRTHARLLQAQGEVERLAKVAERERIGRDLHDLLGHTLSLITLKAELAGKLFTRDPQAARREIADLERISREALKEVRSAVSGYRAEDLRAELARARMALDAADVVLVAEASLPPDLTPAEDSALAFALREAVTNVIRHAGAKTCRVRIETADGAVRLEVADDGRGGSGKASALAPEGSGLTGMRERLGALSGRVERGSESPEGGTRLVITLPYAAGRPTAAGSGDTPPGATFGLEQAFAGE
jgi:two-component system sensor histidine kinase DesK